MTTLSERHIDDCEKCQEVLARSPKVCLAAILDHRNRYMDHWKDPESYTAELYRRRGDVITRVSATNSILHARVQQAESRALKAERLVVRWQSWSEKQWMPRWRRVLRRLRNKQTRGVS